MRRFDDTIDIDEDNIPDCMMNVRYPDNDIDGDDAVMLIRVLMMKTMISMEMVAVMLIASECQFSRHR